MILLLLVTFFGILVSLLYGWMLEFIAVKLLNLNDDHDLHFSVTIIFGVALLAGLLGVWSFYRGVGTRSVLFFSILAFLVIVGIRKYVFNRLKVIYRQLKSFSVLSWFILAGLLVYALFLAASVDPTGDVGLYHAQAIRWIEKYQVVPGLANLHFRLGFNSNLFLLAAFWGFAGFEWHLYQIPGFIIFLSLTMYCLYLQEQLRTYLALSGLIALGFMIYLLYFYRLIWWLASPTTDLPVALITWLIFLLAMEKLETRQVERFDLSISAILVLSLFDVTIKLSALPVLLVPAYFLWKVRGALSLQRILSLLLVFSSVFFSWLARNIVISGYLIFPFAQLDIFHVDWKVPTETVRQYATIVMSFARIPSQNTNVVASMTLRQWVPIWFQTLPANDSFLLFGIVVGIVSSLIFTIVNLQTIIRFGRIYGLILVVSFLGAVFWFTMSPSPRFGYGFLVTLFLILYGPMIMLILEKVKALNEWLIFIVRCFLIVSIVAFLAQFPIKSWLHYLNSVKPYPEADTKAFSFGNQTIFLPISGDQCWYDAFPCTPTISPGLNMRGPSLADGFYIAQK